MRRNKELPEWMRFPTEQGSTNDKAIIKLDETTVNRLDDLVEDSHGQTRADVIANLVYDGWVSKFSSENE